MDEGVTLELERRAFCTQHTGDQRIYSLLASPFHTSKCSKVAGAAHTMHCFGHAPLGQVIFPTNPAVIQAGLRFSKEARRALHTTENGMTFLSPITKLEEVPWDE